MSTPFVMLAVAISVAAFITVRDRRAKKCCQDRPCQGAVGEWQMTVVCSLKDAEEMLDRLENCGVVERDLETLGNNRFAVKWK